MTNAILKGKPYAGNPHVRFDERTVHRLAAVLAIALAFATGGASAADPYYWTGATSADYNTAGNWSSNRVAVATYAPYWRWASTPMYFETADIVSYRIEFGEDSYARGHWYINAGTETQPLEFYCANDKTLVSPDCKTYNYASGLNIALTSDSWVWINGGQWDAFVGDATIGSSDYAAHLLIGNDRDVATTFVVSTNSNSNTGNFYLNQGSVVVSNATMNIDRKLYVGNTEGKLTSFDFCNSTMVVGDYFDVKNYATFDLCGGSITNAARYLTVDYAGEMTIRNGGRYSCQPQIIVGNNSAGTLNIIDGGEAASGSNLVLGYRDGSSGTVNIANGGILTVPYIYLRYADASATVALDGGTIRAAKDNERLIRSANNLHVTVGANGGTIDAAGYNVTIEEDLDNASGETGAMTFKGGGTVTLSGAINYTGCTTVEVGTTLIVKSAIAGDKLAFTIPNGLADGVYEVVRISGSDEKFAEDVLENVTQSPTALFVLNSARTGIYLYKGLVEGDDKVWTGTAGDGKLSSAENWLDGKQPVAGDVLNFSAVTANLALNADLGEVVPATMVFGTKLITITNGTLTVNTLTNASKLAVASTGSLTVTGDLVATVESEGGSQTFLHSNEGTVTVGGKAIGYTNVGGYPDVFEYAAVTENTRPIQARGIAYQCVGSGQLEMKLQSDGNTAGSWVVGADGFSFPGCRNANYTTFFAESAAVTLYSADNWTLANSTKYNTTRGDLYVSNVSGSSLVIDTSDYVTPETRRTVTLKGRIVAYNPVTIKGCGTVVVDTTGSSTHDTVPEDFRHTCLTNSATLYVTDTATLQVNAGKKITGNGTISLAAGTTLALASTGREFTTPEIVPVTLPAEGAATINIDGTRLRGGEHVLCTLASVPENLADHVTVTGTALDGRKYEVTENDGELVFNIYPDGLMIIVR